MRRNFCVPMFPIPYTRCHQLCVCETRESSKQNSSTHPDTHTHTHIFPFASVAVGSAVTSSTRASYSVVTSTSFFAGQDAGSTFVRACGDWVRQRQPLLRGSSQSTSHSIGITKRIPRKQQSRPLPGRRSTMVARRRRSRS